MRKFPVRLSLCRTGVVVGLALSSVSLHAELVFLKNGDVLQGRIVSQTADNVRVQTAGSSQLISKSDIARISYDAEEERLWLEGQEREKRERAEMERLRAEAEQMRAESLRREQELKAREEQLGEYQTRLAGAWWRSLLWPGWGQYYRGETVKGALVAGAAGLMLIQLYRADQDYRNASAAFDEASVLSLASAAGGNAGGIAGAYAFANEARNTKQTAAARGNLMLGLFAAWYVYNVIDAYFADNRYLQPASSAPIPAPTRSEPSDESGESDEVAPEASEGAPSESTPPATPGSEAAPGAHLFRAAEQEAAASLFARSLDRDRADLPLALAWTFSF